MICQLCYQCGIRTILLSMYFAFNSSAFIRVSSKFSLVYENIKKGVHKIENLRSIFEFVIIFQMFDCIITINRLDVQVMK